METVQTIMTVLSFVGILALFYRLRAADERGQKLREDMLASMRELRREAAVRRVIKTLDDVPPELLSDESREYIGHVIDRTHINAAQAVKTTVEIGVIYSEINRRKNLAAGFDEDAPLPDDEDDPCPDDPDDEPMN